MHIKLSTPQQAHASTYIALIGEDVLTSKVKI